MTTKNQKFCRAKHKGAPASGCTLLIGHAGHHFAMGKGAFGPKAFAWEGDKGPTNDWPVCGERCPSTPEWRCARPDEHDGPHRVVPPLAQRHLVLPGPHRQPVGREVVRLVPRSVGPDRLTRPVRGPSLPG